MFTIYSLHDFGILLFLFRIEGKGVTLLSHRMFNLWVVFT